MTVKGLLGVKLYVKHFINRIIVLLEAWVKQEILSEHIRNFP